MRQRGAVRQRCRVGTLALRSPWLIPVIGSAPPDIAAASGSPGATLALAPTTVSGAGVVGAGTDTGADGGGVASGAMYLKQGGRVGTSGSPLPLRGVSSLSALTSYSPSTCPSTMRQALSAPTTLRSKQSVIQPQL